MKTGKIMKRLTILVATLALALTVSAQQYERYFNRPFANLRITVGGGLNAMLYDNENGESSPGLCFDMGVHYTQFFSGFGVGIGVHLSSLGASAKYSYDEVTPNLIHANNPDAQYDLTTSFNNWRERQTITALGVPIEAFYRFSMGNGRHFICGLGMQFDMAVRGKYGAGGGDYTTTGLFHVARPHSIGDMPEHGFSTYDETFDARITDFKVGISAVADLGVHLPLGFSGGLYIGIFGGFGITSILDATEGTTPMLTINPDDASVIDYYGTFAANGNPSLHLLRVGVKLGIDIGSPIDN